MHVFFVCYCLDTYDTMEVFSLEEEGLNELFLTQQSHSPPDLVDSSAKVVFWVIQWILTRHV